MQLRSILSTLFCSFFLLLLEGHAQVFEDFLARMHDAPVAHRAMLIDSLMHSFPSTPLIERDSVVHFLYRGEAASVAVAGDANGWSATATPMQRVAGTDLWYATMVFEPDARLDYKLVVDGAWMLDPGNLHTVGSGFGPNSEVRMPRVAAAPEPPEDARTPRGSIVDTTISSSDLGNVRTVRVYLPAGYEATMEQYPVALFHDGLEYITLAQADKTLDDLIARGAISPVIAVFVPPVDREPEYAGDRMPRFASFIVDEVMGWVRRRFRIHDAASARATIGASNGGNISLYLAATHPETFGCAAGQSSSIVPIVSNLFRRSNRIPVRIHLDVGTYDIPDIIRMTRAFTPVLDARRYDYAYREYHEGHSWGNWRAHLRDALVYFFGAGTKR
jgi:enterochelin esterase-like enzyme